MSDHFAVRAMPGFLTKVVSFTNPLQSFFLNFKAVNIKNTTFKMWEAVTILPPKNKGIQVKYLVIAAYKYKLVWFHGIL